MRILHLQKFGSGYIIGIRIRVQKLKWMGSILIRIHIRTAGNQKHLLTWNTGRVCQCRRYRCRRRDSCDARSTRTHHCCKLHEKLKIRTHEMKKYNQEWTKKRIFSHFTVEVSARYLFYRPTNMLRILFKTSWMNEQYMADRRVLHQVPGTKICTTRSPAYTYSIGQSTNTVQTQL